MRSDEHDTHEHDTHEHDTDHHAHPHCPRHDHGHSPSGQPHEGRHHGRGGGRGHEHASDDHPTLVRSIAKSARRIRRSGLTAEQLQHRIAATVSHADYVTTMRTLQRIGNDLRHER